METYDIPFYEARKAALITEIEAAFDGVSREGGVSMSEALVIDDYDSDEERAAARLRDIETRWQDVPDEDLKERWPLHFFDPIGFAYYLPAYLIWYLRNIDSADDDDIDYYDMNFDHLGYFLAAGFNKQGVEEHYLSDFQRLSPLQHRTVAHFLELEAERIDAIQKEMAESYVTLPEEERPNEKELSEEEKEQFDRDLATEMELPSDRLEIFVSGLKKHRAEHDSPKNDARYALEKYWGQFL